MAEQMLCIVESAAWMAGHAIRIMGDATWMTELSIFMFGECSLLWLDG